MGQFNSSILISFVRLRREADLPGWIFVLMSLLPTYSVSLLCLSWIPLSNNHYKMISCNWPDQIQESLQTPISSSISEPQCIKSWGPVKLFELLQTAPWDSVLVFRDLRWDSRLLLHNQSSHTRRSSIYFLGLRTNFSSFREKEISITFTTNVV